MSRGLTIMVLALRMLALGQTQPGQILVVDRVLPSSEGLAEPVERGENKGFVGDSFTVGAKGEVWVLDRLRVWAKAGDSKACRVPAGDRVEKIVLLGALDNPPTPGQPLCACHALIQIATAAFQPGASSPANPGRKPAPESHLRRLDFENLRWSVPGGMVVLFAVRAMGRESATACTAGEDWALAASPAAGQWRLFTFDKDGLEDGFRSGNPPRWLNVQVWAHRSP